MKKLLSVFAVVLSLALVGVSMDAKAAKRMGSGKSVGMQRQSVQDKAPPAPIAQSGAPSAAGAGAAAAPRRSWMGPIAGLAAGLGIAALASHLGFGDELASMVMMGLLAVAVMALMGFIMRKRLAAQQGGLPSSGGLMPAGAGHASNLSPGSVYKVSMPSNSGHAGSSGSLIGTKLFESQAKPQLIPAEFDQAAFERNAKVNFLRLQAAYDSGNLDDLREFTSPEMFAELKLDIQGRETGRQHGDVVRLDATVMQVTEENNVYFVSVKFTGFIRYGAGTDDEVFDEIWHLSKPRQGSSGWVLSGIQQSD